MNKKIEAIEKMLEEVELNVDVQELEDVITPGSGFGCDCD